MSRIWGVHYTEVDPVTPYVEEADDQRDAEAWLQASGDPTARVVYSDDDGKTWQVSE